MTNEELEKKIEMLRGQGNQVDVGGVLADVLKELAPKSANCLFNAREGERSVEEFARVMNATEEEAIKLFDKDVKTMSQTVLGINVAAERTAYISLGDITKVGYEGFDTTDVNTLKYVTFTYDRYHNAVTIERIR